MAIADYKGRILLCGGLGTALIATTIGNAIRQVLQMS